MKVRRARELWMSDRRKLLMTSHEVRHTAAYCSKDLVLRGMAKASFATVWNLPQWESARECKRTEEAGG